MPPECVTADHEIVNGTDTLAPLAGASGVGAASVSGGGGGELGVQPESVAEAEVDPSLTVTRVFGSAPRPSMRSFDPLSSARVSDTAADATGASVRKRRASAAGPSH